MLFQSESATGAKLRKVDYLLHIILNRNIASDWCASLKAVNTGALVWASWKQAAANWKWSAG